MSIDFESDSDDYVLIIEKWGDHAEKVHMIVKEITGKSTSEMAVLRKQEPVIIATGEKRQLTHHSTKLQSSGAKTAIRLR